MKIKSNLKLVSTFFKGLIIGSIAVTRATAVMAPPAPDGIDAFTANWEKLKNELDSGQGQLPLRDELIDILNLTDLEQDLEFAVRTSYAIATPEEVTALDSHWVDTFISRGGSQQMSQYLALRTTMQVQTPNGESNYLDWWLWNASGGGGDCDGGGGGGGGKW